MSTASLCTLLLLLSVCFPPVCLSSSSSPSSVVCGLDKYDFSSLGELVGVADDYSFFYYLNLCASVKELWCTLNTNTADVQGCQVVSSDTSQTYGIMGSQQTANQTVWRYTNGHDAQDGISWTADTGEKNPECPNEVRVIIGHITCGQTTEITRVTEEPRCTYNLFLHTPLVCRESAHSLESVEATV